MGNCLDLGCCNSCIGNRKYSDEFYSDSFDSQANPPEFYQFSYKSTSNPSFLADSNSHFNFCTDENRSLKCSAILGSSSLPKIPPMSAFNHFN